MTAAGPSFTCPSCGGHIEGLGHRTNCVGPLIGEDPLAFARARGVQVDAVVIERAIIYRQSLIEHFRRELVALRAGLDQLQHEAWLVGT